MFKKLTKSRLVVAVVAVTVAVPATAMAIDTFDDVPTEKFYHGPVEWAFNNNITTGSPAGADTFKPEDPVTRGESVTFLKRYNDNIVEPAIADLQSGIGDFVGLFATDTRGADFQEVTSSPFDLGLSATVTIPEGRTGVIEIVFNSQTRCAGGGIGGFCETTIKNNGAAVGGEKQIIDSSDNGVESGNSWESHSIVRITEDLPAGDYTITVEASEGTGSPAMSHRYATVTAEVHLTS